MTLGIVLVAAITGTAANLAVQIGLCRYIAGFSLLKSLVIGFAFGGAVSVVTVLFGGAPPDLAWAALVLYASAGYCYFHFVNMGETARRIRLVRELEAAPGRRLAREDLLARYSNDDVIAKRIARLVGAGQLRFSGDVYTIGAPAMYAISRVLLIFRKLVFGRPF